MAVMIVDNQHSEGKMALRTDVNVLEKIAVSCRILNHREVREGQGEKKEKKRKLCGA